MKKGLALVILLLVLVGCTSEPAATLGANLEVTNDGGPDETADKEPQVEDIPEFALEKECEKYPWPPSCKMVPHAQGRKLCERCKEFKPEEFEIPGFDIPKPPTFELGCNEMPPDCGMLPLKSARQKCEECRTSPEGALEISPGVSYELPPLYDFPVVFGDALNYLEYDDHFKNLDIKKLKELGFNTFYLLPEYYWSYDDNQLHLHVGRFSTEKIFKDHLASFIKQAHYYEFNIILGTTTIGCHGETDESGRIIKCQPVSFPCSQFSPVVPKPDGELCTIFTEQLVEANKEWLQFSEEHNIERFTFGEWDTPYDNGPYAEQGVKGLTELITYGNEIFSGKLTVGNTRDVKERYNYKGLDQLGVSFYPEGSHETMLNQWVQTYDKFSVFAKEDGLPEKVIITETYLPDALVSWAVEFSGGVLTSIDTHTEQEIAAYYDELLTNYKDQIAGITYTWSEVVLGMENKPLLQEVWRKHFGQENVLLPEGNDDARCCPITLDECGPAGGGPCCVGVNCPDFARCAFGEEPCCPRNRDRCY